MGRALADAFPICRQVFAEADAALGQPLSRLCFEGPEDQLMLTANTQPPFLTVSIAASGFWPSRGIERPSSPAHSLGEYFRQRRAGTFDSPTRSHRESPRPLHAGAVPVGTGAMAAVLGLDADKVPGRARKRQTAEIVEPANRTAVARS